MFRSGRFQAHWQLSDNFLPIVGWLAPQERHRRWHRSRRRTCVRVVFVLALHLALTRRLSQLRRCHEATDSGGRQRRNLRCQVQDIRVWLCYRIELLHDGAGQGLVPGGGRENKKQRYSGGVVLAPSQAPLLK